MVLTKECFYPYFPSREKANAAFNLFDADNSNTVDKKEFVHVILSFYNSRKSLSSGIKDLNTSVASIGTLFDIFTVLILIWVILGIFQVPLESYIISASSLLLAMAFMITNAANNFFVCIVYLFFSHPYDVGDLIMIKDQTYSVKKINILTTVLVGADGRETMFQNSCLATETIVNLNRSKDFSETISVRVPLEIGQDKLNLLEESLLEFVKSKPKD